MYSVNINTLQQKLPNITLLVLVPVMIATLSFQAYSIFTPTTEASVNQAKEPMRQVKARSSTQNIKNYQLFGSSRSANAEKAVVKTENLPKTNLRLILRGVSATGENSSNASALIEGPNKETLKYSIKDSLPGKAKLKSVYANRIVIERNGRLENLYFPDAKNIGIVSSAESTGLQSNSSPQALNQSAQVTPAPTISTAIPQAHIPQNFSRPASNLDALSDQRKEEIKKRLQQLREKMKQPQ